MSWNNSLDAATSAFWNVTWRALMAILADLDEFLARVGQRPVRDSLRQCQRPHEVGEIVGECMTLKPDGIGGERALRRRVQFIAFSTSLILCSQVPR
jgi:hypothetical protein